MSKNGQSEPERPRTWWPWAAFVVLVIVLVVIAIRADWQFLSPSDDPTESADVPVNVPIKIADLSGAVPEVKEGDEMSFVVLFGGENAASDIASYNKLVVSRVLDAAGRDTWETGGKPDTILFDVSPGDRDAILWALADKTAAHLFRQGEIEKSPQQNSSDTYQRCFNPDRLDMADTELMAGDLVTLAIDVAGEPDKKITFYDLKVIGSEDSSGEEDNLVKLQIASDVRAKLTDSFSNRDPEKKPALSKQVPFVLSVSLSELSGQLPEDAVPGNYLTLIILREVGEEIVAKTYRHLRLLQLQDKNDLNIVDSKRAAETAVLLLDANRKDFKNLLDDFNNKKGVLLKSQGVPFDEETISSDDPDPDDYVTIEGSLIKSALAEIKEGDEVIVLVVSNRIDAEDNINGSHAKSFDAVVLGPEEIDQTTSNVRLFMGTDSATLSDFAKRTSEPEVKEIYLYPKAKETEEAE